MSEHEHDRREAGASSALVAELRRVIADQQGLIEAQQRQIARHQDRERNLTLWQRYHPVLGLVRWIRRLKRRVLPGVGQLRQHAPRPLRLPLVHVAPPEHPPSISIVTPNLNGARFLEKTLLSVLDQGYPALEYRVADGGSSDGSTAVLARYASRLREVSSGPDGGRTQALNAAFAQSNGSIMAWLSSDDLLLPGALAYVARYFTEHPEVDAIYGYRIVIDADDLEIGRWVLPAHEDGILSWADFVPQETLFWRRSLWERIGGRLDESYRFALDWDLLLRFRDAGARFERVPRFLGAFRVHEMQQTMREMDTTGRVEMARLRERCHGRAVSEAEAGRACRRYQWRSIGYALMYRLGLPRA